MTLPANLEADILRYHHVEKWPVGTIARQLGVSRSAVRRVLQQAGLPRSVSLIKSTAIEPYLPFIHETLKVFPNLTASRLYDMVCVRGYTGGPDHFRHLIALHRPRKEPEAYLRLTTLPGEQAQVDWAHFGHLQIGQAQRPLMAFVMVLSFSRRPFLHFCLDARMENFLRGHVAAFETWQGIPRVLLYDNLKSAVLERRGEAIRFNPTLLDFASHYHFQPKPVAVARGNEKGRVERTIRYIRTNFFAARQFKDIDDLNAQALEWCHTRASVRPCPENRARTVGQVFEDERPSLMTLPDTPYPIEENVPVSIGKTPYARFDLNDYSIPYQYVRRNLTVVADTKRVRIIDRGQVIAEHARSYDRRTQVENPAHIRELVDRKQQGRHHRATDRLARSVPSSVEFLVRAAAAGHQPGTQVAALLRYLDRYGAEELEEAVNAAGLQGALHSHTVRLVLEKQREAKRSPPPIDHCLPEHIRQKDAAVRPHALDGYDALAIAASTLATSGPHSNKEPSHDPV